jgi:Flp pilus assembly pilin Flp
MVLNTLAGILSSVRLPVGILPADMLPADMLPVAATYKSFKGFLKDEDGLGTVEVVLILAVLVGIALIFREYLFDFVNDIIQNILGDPLNSVRNHPLEQ